MSFEVINPNPDSPIVVSVPHCGVKIPGELRDQYLEEKIDFIDDTDWYVDRLYDFVTEMGFTMIRAKYSRWVIDLNRNSTDQPLYDDGRVITALTPTTDFNGQSIYKESSPDATQIKRRIEAYYQPYYAEIAALIKERRERFDHVLFYDCHSIRRYVPGIRSEPFPDLILGDVDETSAHPTLIGAAVKVLSDSGFSFQHNDPFKGGNLTSHFADPENGVHALQLEMSKVLYMNDSELLYREDRAENVRKVLRRLFEELQQVLTQMNQR